MTWVTFLGKAELGSSRQLHVFWVPLPFLCFCIARGFSFPRVYRENVGDACFHICGGCRHLLGPLVKTSCQTSFLTQLLVLNRDDPLAINSQCGLQWQTEAQL